MRAPVGLNARQAIPLTSALLLLLTASLSAAAQEGAAATPDTDQPAGVDEAASAGGQGAPRPGRLKPAQHPKGGLGLRVFDLIEGGPGYIAVGGGTPTGLDHQALVWLSDDGVHWQSQPLFGDAATGTMRAAAALPDGGFVAIGHDFVPQTERAELVHAIVWHSADGFRWERVPADASFAGSMMWDVTTTPDGVAVAGCTAGFHCDVGRVWTSTDGLSWELVDDIAMAPYGIASDQAGNLVIGGEDDAYDLTGGQAAAAASAEDWTVRVFGTGDSEIHGAAPYGDGFLLAGSLRSSMSGEYIGSALQVSSDGIDWDVHEPEQLEGLFVLDADTSGGSVALVGQRQTRARGSVPEVLWTRDLETFVPVRLPRRASIDTFGAEDVRFADDGARLFVTGTSKGRPAIWTTTIE